MNSLRDDLRTLFILGRVSNLPTVWSNILTGWLIVNGPPFSGGFFLLIVGVSLLYTGGMYLNDYCDADFDAKFCPERPIPSGKITRSNVRLITLIWFIGGLICLFPFGVTTSEFSILLLAAIVLYDYRHKGVSWAPPVMGVCRMLLYPLAASAVIGEKLLFNSYEFTPNDPDFLQELGTKLTLAAVLISIPLGLYVAGITYLARGESRPGKPTRWALLLLLAPLVAAWGTHSLWSDPSHPASIFPIVLAGLLQLGWMAWLLIPLWLKSEPSIGRVVSGLLAGIVLVDMIVVATLLGSIAFLWLPLFALALILQHRIPAT